MYTGIVDHCGEIIEVKKNNHDMFVTIQTNFTELQIGESIAIDGICVTVIDPQEKQFSCELSPETLRLTTANTFKVGTKVNLERSLQAGDRLGGHFVMGHIDGVAKVTARKPQQDFIYFQFGGLPKAAQAFLIHKGSVAVNGVSLTINEVTEDGFSVMLIPHTLSRTNLNQLQENSLVNIEYDQLARIIAKQMRLMHESTASSLEKQS